MWPIDAARTSQHTNEYVPDENTSGAFTKTTASNTVTLHPNKCLYLFKNSTNTNSNYDCASTVKLQPCKNALQQLNCQAPNLLVYSKSNITISEKKDQLRLCFNSSFNQVFKNALQHSTFKVQTSLCIQTPISLYLEKRRS